MVVRVCGGKVSGAMIDKIERQGEKKVIHLYVNTCNGILNKKIGKMTYEQSEVVYALLVIAAAVETIEAIRILESILFIYYILLIFVCFL